MATDLNFDGVETNKINKRAAFTDWNLCHPGLTVQGQMITLPNLAYWKSASFEGMQRGEKNEILINQSTFAIENYYFNQSVRQHYYSLAAKLKWENTQIDLDNCSLLIIPEGSSFRYKPTEPTQNNIASLMVGLPSFYEGGNVVCYEKDPDDVIFTTESPDCFFENTIILHLSEMNLKISKILTGTRMYLVYPITSSSPMLFSIKKYRSSINVIENRLKSWNGNVEYLSSCCYKEVHKLHRICDEEQTLYYMILEANNNLIGTPNEIEIWIRPFKKKHTFRRKNHENFQNWYFKNEKLKCIQTNFGPFLGHTFRYFEEEEDKDKDKDIAIDKRIIILKKSYVFDFLRERSNSFLCFLNFFISRNSISIDNLMNQLEKVPEKELEGIPFDGTWFNILSKLLLDANNFMQCLKKICFLTPYVTKSIENFGGLHYDESRKYNLIDYNETMLINPKTKKILCYEYEYTWERYNQYAQNDLDSMMELPNGILVIYTLERGMDEKSQRNCIYCNFESVFYNPNFKLIQNSINEFIQQKYSNGTMPLKVFLKFCKTVDFVEYYDIISFISLIGEFEESKGARKIVNLITEKYWPVISKDIINIINHIEFTDLMVIICKLYDSTDEFYLTIANQFIPILINIIQNLDFTKPNASTYNQNYIHLFYILCCHSGSFKLAELGKDLKFLEVISKTKYSTFDIPENDTWHKFFVNARLQELIEKYESIKPTLPLIPVDKSLLKNMQ